MELKTCEICGRQREALSYCEKCGKLICDECSTSDGKENSKEYCPKCYAETQYKKPRLKVGQIYEITDHDGEIVIGEYMGRQKDWNCCVCDKGSNAMTFNIFQNRKNTDDGYQTWGYGACHLPKIKEIKGDAI